MFLTVALFGMTTIAAALVIFPLLKGIKKGPHRSVHEIEVFRNQLEEININFTRGLIARDEAEAARVEIEFRILACDGHGNHDAAETKSRSPVAAVIAGICIPAVAALIYTHTGRPVLSENPTRAVIKTNTLFRQTDVQNHVTSLASALQKNPENTLDWIKLGSILIEMKQYERAAIAYTQAMNLAPQNADFASRTGEALTFAAGGQVTSRAKKLFQEALRRNPGEPRSHYYIGLADFQAGRLRSAFNRWINLERTLRPGAPRRDFLGRKIMQAAEQLKIDADTLAGLRRHSPDTAATRKTTKLPRN